MLCCCRHTFISNAYKSDTLPITDIIVWSVVARIYLQLQDIHSFICFMRNHLNLWQWVHIIPNLIANRFANTLYVIKPFNNPIIVNPDKQRTAEAIGKSAHTLQPTFRSFLF